MNKRLKILLGVLAFSPILLTICLPPILEEHKPIDATREEMESFHDMFKLILMIMWVWCVSLIIGFCVYALKSPFVHEQKRKLWVAVLFFGNFISLPFFWYWYIWKLESKSVQNET